MLRARLALAAAAVVAALVVTTAGGCSASVADPPATIALPPVHGAADYQLGGSYTPPDGVTVVTRDSTSKPAKGIYSICYVNGFQTQPGVKWPSSLIVHTKSGKPLVDPGWPDEHIIDISTRAKRLEAATIVGGSTKSCATKGFEAVEFDNLDSYSRSKGALTLAQAIAFAKLLVKQAHADGLAAGQKNTAQLGSRGKTQIGYDFAVSEECDTYDECGTFTTVYGSNVLDVEYTDDLRGTFAEVCARSATPPMTILRDRDLTTPKSADYVYEAC
ncbi:glycosyl hydrolase family 114 [Frondihabitans sp. PhB188]|uniref:endo alpha-1,4 polygalactosaminidase n=1 Tax=Frondihabitans sp. PhB188 TaxID=2485200 RepID=UPI000F499C7D|nr:endo alpha-1,4 polygalactosaminidase [Frondihabitans sp. PhB188]ROQ39845.1 glycosyl hydrolase family 114 [Frondihabitans sp. PhB188]